MNALPRIDDDQRRTRLGTRQAISPAHRVDSVLAAAESVVCLHSTEPASVYLSTFARAEVTHADLETALYADRTLVKKLAMRRTLFAFPHDLLPAAWGSASARVVGQTVQQLGTDLLRNDLVPDRDAATTWVTERVQDVVAHLRANGPATTTELRSALPDLDTRVDFAPGTTWGGSQPVAARVLTAAGEILRGENAAGWRVTRPRWTATQDWLGHEPSRLGAREGYAPWWWLGCARSVRGRKPTSCGGSEPPRPRSARP